MASVTITGTLRDAFGVALANYDILFEAVRTSDVVLNSTSAKGVTSSTGTYTFELGYGTYTLKIKSNRESQYRTVASNILVYSQIFDSHDLNFLLTSQLNLQDIDESLLGQLLTVKADTLAYRDAAAASAIAAENSRIATVAQAAAALTSANNADISEANALTSANNADISEANALTSANNAGISESNAQKWAENPENVAVVTGQYSAKHHAIKAAASAASALSSANAADISEANALASANAADISEANALASANTAAMYAASMAAAISENGNVDLSSGIAPTPLKDGSNNNISTLWKVTVAGTVNSISYAVGDSIVYSKALNGYYKIDSTDQVTSVNGMSGAVTVTTITGNAGTATKLATARSISTSGDITWTVSFDGSANVTAAAALSTTGVTTGTYKSVTVDSKGRVTAATNPTTLAGFGITDAQPLDSDLTAIAGLTTNGIIIRTAAGTATTRSIAVSGSGISITNADGINGNPTIASNATALNTASTLVSRDVSGNFAAGTITAALSGNATTASTLQTARTIAITGTEGSGTATSFNGSANIEIPFTLATTGVTAGTYKSVTVDTKGRVTAGTNPTTLSGYGITDAQPLDSDLTAIAGLASLGLVTRTAAGAMIARTIALSGNGISISNADGILGNPTITSNATNVNTPSTLVYRDASGNFSAGIISASILKVDTLTDNAGNASIPVNDIVDRTRLNEYGAFSFRNKIVDGRMDFWYEGTSQTTSGYGSDTMCANYNSGTTKVHTRELLIAGVDLPSIKVPTAKYFSRTVVTSVAGVNNYARKSYAIEDVSTLAGKTAIVSFLARADSSKFIGISFTQSFGSGGSPSVVLADPTFVKTIDNNWSEVQVAIQVPNIAGKTLGVNNCIYLQIWFDAGTALSINTTAAGVVMPQQSGTFDVACVQLEEGSVATPFEELPIEIAQQRVNRYYRSDFFAAYQRIVIGYAYSTTDIRGFITYSIPMRAVPTVTMPTYTAVETVGITSSAVAVAERYTTGFNFTITAAGLTARWAIEIRGANATGGCYFISDARL